MLAAKDDRNYGSAAFILLKDPFILVIIATAVRRLIYANLQVFRHSLRNRALR
jgi:hypothetical protein